MKIPSHPLFFFEVQKHYEEREAFEMLIGREIRWAYFKKAITAFLLYMASLICLYIPERLLQPDMAQMIQQWCPVICRCIPVAIAGVFLLEEVHYRYLAVSSRRDAVLRKSKWYLGENEEVLLFVKPDLFGDSEDAEMPLDPILEDDSRMREYIHALSEKMESIPAADRTWKFLMKRGEGRAGLSRILRRIASMELCVYQHDMGNDVFFEKEGFENYRSVGSVEK